MELPFERVRPLPNCRLVSVISFINWMSAATEWQVSAPEFAEALHTAYDGDTMPLFDGGGCGLAHPIGDFLGDVPSYNVRVECIDEIFNSKFWKKSDSVAMGHSAVDLMITRDDAYQIARALWHFFGLANQLPELKHFSEAFDGEDPKERNAVIPESLDKRIHGSTFERLARAIAAFPARYPGYKERPPKLDDDVRQWLKEAGLADSEAERRVFGTIIREHFELSPDTQNT